MRGGADDPGLSKERQSEATMTDRAGSPAYAMAATSRAAGAAGVTLATAAGFCISMVVVAN